jgi:hypothetical protein
VPYILHFDESALSEMIVQSSDTGSEMVRALLAGQEYGRDINIWHIG